MAAVTFYLLGFRSGPLAGDEQQKLDAHISNWNSGWSGDPYKPIDTRDPGFNDVYQTFEEDEKRPDGTHIVLYQEMNTGNPGDKDRFLDAVKDIKGVFPDVQIEAYDEGGKLA